MESKTIFFVAQWGRPFTQTSSHDLDPQGLAKGQKKTPWMNWNWWFIAVYQLGFLGIPHYTLDQLGGFL